MVGPADEIRFAISSVRRSGQSQDIFIVIRHFFMLDDVESEKSEFDHPHGYGSPLFRVGIKRPHVLAGAPRADSRMVRLVSVVSRSVILLNAYWWKRPSAHALPPAP